MKARILVVDDDEAEIRRSVRMILEYEGYDVIEASSGPEGVALAEREAPDLVFLDIKMPGMDGLEALQRIKASNETPPVVILSGHGTVRTAVEATKAGAFDFIEKPLASERVLVTIRNALDQTRLRDENRSLKRAVEVRHQMVGESPSLRQVWDAVRRAAPTNATVLITGESGVGQGAGRARHPPQQPAQGRALRAGQLRGHPRGADRERALRPREGLVHRRDREADRQVRAGPQGHDLPGRGRRHEPAHPGQGAARPAGGRGRAHRLPEDDQGGRARHRRHQQGPRGGDREGRLPRGPLLPPQRHPHPRAAAARARRGHPGARAALREAVLRREQLRPKPSRPRPSEALKAPRWRGATSAS